MVFYERASCADACAYFPRRRRAPGTCRKISSRHRPAFCRSPFLKVLRRSRDLLTATALQAAQCGISASSSSRTPGLGAFPCVMVRGSAPPGTCASSALHAIPSSISTSRSKNGDCYIAIASALRDAARRSGSEACIERLPRRKGRPVTVADNNIVPPLRHEMNRSMEALIHHVSLYTEGFHVPPARSCRGRGAEASSASTGLRRHQNPTKGKIRAPGFAHLAGDGFILPRPHAGRRVVGARSLESVFGRDRCIDVPYGFTGGRHKTLPPPPCRGPARDFRLQRPKSRLAKEPDRRYPEARQASAVMPTAMARPDQSGCAAAEGDRATSPKFLACPGIRVLEIAYFLHHVHSRAGRNVLRASGAAPRPASAWRED